MSALQIVIYLSSAVFILYNSYKAFCYLNPKKKTSASWVIFDFDGTIADSFLCAVESVNQWATWYGYVPIREDELVRLRHYSMYNLVRNRLGLKSYQLPLFHYRIKQTLLKCAATATPCKGIEEEIQLIKAAGYKIAIVSSNSSKFITAFFKTHKLPAFDAIEESSIFGKDRYIKQCMRTNGIDPERAIYIGDEARDIEAAKRIPLQMIAVSWGGSSAALLVRHMPTAIIHQPDALTPLVKAMVPLNKNS